MLHLSRGEVYVPCHHLIRMQVAIVGDIRASMLDEVDFRKEAMNIEAFRNYVGSLGLSNQATAPFVYRHCSTERVLTMERLFGVPLTDLESLRSIVPNPETTLITALNVWSVSLTSCNISNVRSNLSCLRIIHSIVFVSIWLANSLHAFHSAFLACDFISLLFA